MSHFWNDQTNPSFLLTIPTPHVRYGNHVRNKTSLFQKNYFLVQIVVFFCEFQRNNTKAKRIAIFSHPKNGVLFVKNGSLFLSLTPPPPFPNSPFSLLCFPSAPLYLSFLELKYLDPHDKSEGFFPRRFWVLGTNKAISLGRGVPYLNR